MSWTGPIEGYRPVVQQLDEIARFRIVPPLADPRVETAAKVNRLRVQVNDSHRHVRNIMKNLDIAIRRGQAMRTLKLQAELDKSRRKLVENKGYLNEALGAYYAVGGRSMTVLHGWTP